MPVGGKTVISRWQKVRRSPFAKRARERLHNDNEGKKEKRASVHVTREALGAGSVA
jgi:hypothetical protein